MKALQRWQNGTAALVIAWSLAACGGGGGGSDTLSPVTPPVTPGPVTPPPPVTPVPSEPGAPALTNNIATDGLNWLNFRRSQLGVSVLVRNGQVDAAALGHSNYQRLNKVTHVQEVGKPGFTGVKLFDRLQAIGYANPNNYFYGEVISASTSDKGVYLAEELITAIYHRFAIFEPRFKEIGAGSVTNANNYSILTTNFTANSGYGPGLGRGNLVHWPVNGQTGVVTNFLSDFEEPDPVPDRNEVGYPVSVHVDADQVLTVGTFTIRARGGSDLQVKLLSTSADPVNMEHTRSAASIVPLTKLLAATTYDVAFTGSTADSNGANSTAVTKSWSFTTR